MQTTLLITKETKDRLEKVFPSKMTWEEFFIFVCEKLESEKR